MPNLFGNSTDRRRDYRPPACETHGHNAGLAGLDIRKDTSVGPIEVRKEIAFLLPAKIELNAWQRAESRKLAQVVGAANDAQSERNPAEKFECVGQKRNSLVTPHSAGHKQTQRPTRVRSPAAGAWADRDRESRRLHGE